MIDIGIKWLKTWTGNWTSPHPLNDCHPFPAPPHPVLEKFNKAPKACSAHSPLCRNV